MTVYAVHPITEKDVSAALIYGDVEYINARYVYIDEVEKEKIPEAFYNKMLKVVDRFDPENDFLLIAGDHLQLIVMAAELSARWGRFRVLRFDRQAGGYAAILIDTLENME